jgi:hypothetical protein
MFLMLPQEKLIGHTGDVIANDQVPGLRDGQLLVSRRHGAWLTQVVGEKLLEAAHGAVAIFGDRRKIVNMGKKKTLQLGIVRGASFAKACETARRMTDVFYGFDARGT